MENIKNKKLIIFSSRSGGPYKQHHLLYRYLLNDGYNVIHWSGLWKWILLHFFYGKNTKILTNVPFVFRFKKKDYYLNIHGNYNIEKSLSNPLGYLYNKNIKMAEKVIVPSHFLKKKLNLDEAIVIENTREKVTIIKKQNFDYIRLICVTMFAFKEKSEGVLKIIESLSQVKSNIPIKLDIYGQGKYKDEIENLSRHIRLPKNISYFFKGFSNDIGTELNNSDIFLYWSNLESTVPNSIWEAMGYGLPIISNDFESFKDELSKNNFVSHNTREFSDGLTNLILNKSTRERIGKKNRLFYNNLVIRRDRILVQWKNILCLNKKNEN